LFAAVSTVDRRRRAMALRISESRPVSTRFALRICASTLWVDVGHGIISTLHQTASFRSDSPSLFWRLSPFVISLKASPWSSTRRVVDSASRVVILIVNKMCLQRLIGTGAQAWVSFHVREIAFSAVRSQDACSAGINGKSCQPRSTNLYDKRLPVDRFGSNV
jgi:hypothetical protein